MGDHLTKHGDGAKDVSFSVEDLDAIMERAKKKGVKVVKDIFEESDEFGKVRFAVVQTYGDTTHTFIERGKKVQNQFRGKNILKSTIFRKVFWPIFAWLSAPQDERFTFEIDARPWNLAYRSHRGQPT